MLAEVIRHVLYRRRVTAARAWTAEERRQAAHHDAAVRRIVAQDVPDPSGRRGSR
jgi:hypothetical protein